MGAVLWRNGVPLQGAAMALIQLAQPAASGATAAAGRHHSCLNKSSAEAVVRQRALHARSIPTISFAASRNPVEKSTFDVFVQRWMLFVSRAALWFNVLG